MDVAEPISDQTSIIPLLWQLAQQHKACLKVNHNSYFQNYIDLPGNLQLKICVGYKGHSPERFENEDTRAPTELKFSRQGFEQIGTAIATPLIFLQSLFPNAKLALKEGSPNPFVDNPIIILKSSVLP